MKKNISRVFIATLLVIFSIFSVMPTALAKEENLVDENENSETVSLKFREYVNSIFLGDKHYSVLNKDGEDSKQIFTSMNYLEYSKGDYISIRNYFTENQFSFEKSMMGSNLFASSTHNLDKETFHTFTSAGKRIEYTVLLHGSVRFNDGIGKITSYSGPYVSLTYDNAGFIFNSQLTQVSTNAKYGEGQRSITMTGSYVFVATGTIQGATFQHTDQVRTESISF